MPRLPERPIRRPVSLGRPASAIDFGAGEGLEHLGQGLGLIAEAGAAITMAVDQAKLARAEAEATSQIVHLTYELEQNPDYMSREALYQSSSEKIVNAYRSGLRGKQSQEEFDRRMLVVSERSRLDVRQGVRQSKIDESRAEIAEAGRYWADVAGRARTPDQRDSARAAFVLALEKAVEGMTLNREQRQRLLEEFDRQVSDGDVREAIRLDPENAVQLLMDPKSHLAKHLPEETRQRWLQIAEDEVRQRNELLRAEQARMRAEDEYQRQIRAAAAMKDAADLMYGSGLTADWLREHRDDLPVPAYEEFKRIVAAGGRVSPSGPTNWDYYASLRRMRGSFPQEFAKHFIDPTALGAQYQEMLDSQIDVQLGKQYPPPNELTWTQKLEKYLDELGMKDEYQRGPARRLLSDQMRRLVSDATARGKSVSPTEIDEVLTSFGALWTYEPFFQSGKDRAMLEEPDIGAYIERFGDLPGLPMQALPGAIRSLIRRGLPVTADLILAEYQGIPVEILPKLIQELAARGQDPDPTNVRRLYEAALGRRR